VSLSQSWYDNSSDIAPLTHSGQHGLKLREHFSRFRRLPVVDKLPNKLNTETRRFPLDNVTPWLWVIIAATEVNVCKCLNAGFPHIKLPDSWKGRPNLDGTASMSMNSLTSSGNPYSLNIRSHLRRCSISGSSRPTRKNATTCISFLRIALAFLCCDYLLIQPPVRWQEINRRDRVEFERVNEFDKVIDFRNVSGFDANYCRDDNPDVVGEIATG
jgi:hypothetical protein